MSEVNPGGDPEKRAYTQAKLYLLRRGGKLKPQNERGSGSGQQRNLVPSFLGGAHAFLRHQPRGSSKGKGLHLVVATGVWVSRDSNRVLKAMSQFPGPTGLQEQPNVS